MERGHHRAFAADLYRLRGDLARRGEARRADAAQADLCEALKIAREQRSPALELRAATSLARRWVEQGARGKANELLAPIFRRFTEGFGMPDLVHARQVLDMI